MKKLLLLAALMLATATMNTAVAQRRKDKKKTEDKVEVKAEKPLQLLTPSDSLSYIAGINFTAGLMPFLEAQHGIDSAHVADFVRGYQEAVSKDGDVAFGAYVTGLQFVDTWIKQRIMPSVKKNFEDSEYTINDSLFHVGFLAALMGDHSLYTDSAANAIYQERVKQVEEKRYAEHKAQNEQWLKNNATNEGVVTLPSGLQYKVITMGTGEKPAATDEVTVKYEGKLIDGQVFDSSYQRTPQETKFRANQVIKGWTEALTMMPVGSKWELYIPQELAYGERQAGNLIKPYSTLIFTVELISINK